MEIPELKAMETVFNALQGLEAEAQKRVISWVQGTLNISNNTTRVESAELKTVNLAERSIVQFETIGDVFAEASPKTDPERVLLVGTFLQAKQGKSELTGQEINSELKHLGFPVGNITQAISSLMARKPQLMIQTRKGGKSQQARKIYKVTGEGLKAVSQMMTPMDA